MPVVPLVLALAMAPAASALCTPVCTPVAPAANTAAGDCHGHAGIAVRAAQADACPRVAPAVAAVRLPDPSSGSPGGGAAILVEHAVFAPAVSAATRDHVARRGLPNDRRPFETTLRI